MKILLPFNTKNGVTLEDNVVTGGIEMFSRLVKENIDGVIPMYFNDADRKARRVTNMIVEASQNHQPDMILTSYDYRTTNINLAKRLPTIPIAWVGHLGAGPFSKISETVNMNTFMRDYYNSVFLVSKFQYNALSNQCLRFNGFGLDEVSGYIQPAFSNGQEKMSDEIEYEAITIGRSEKIKDPFWLHRKLKKHDVNSIVCTDDNPKEHEYNEKNRKLEESKTTFRALSHSDNMEKLSRSGAYVSTCVMETWGITVLESLSRGVPAIFPTDSSNTHASEEIPASKDHYKLIRKSIKADELVSLIKDFNKMSIDQRQEISEMTKEKHSKENWIKNMNKLIDKTVENKKEMSKKEFFI